MFGRGRADVAEVMPGLLVGSCPSQRQVRGLVERGVVRVVDLRESADGWEWPAGIRVERVPIEDGDVHDVETLDHLAGTIIESLRDGDTTLVHCRAGVGRSVTVVCAVLMRMGYGMGDAYRLLRERRPEAMPTERQVAGLTAYAAHLRGRHAAPQ